MKTLMAWSGGKDSAAALWRLRENPEIELTGLLTTFTGEYSRVSMHGVREELMLAQAEAVGLPLVPAVIPSNCDNSRYEAVMAEVLRQEMDRGLEAVAFGDLYLEDIRAYRERMMAPTGLKTLFPVWGEKTAPLVDTLHQAGFRAKLCVVDPRRLGKAFAGQDFGPELIQSFPEGVDPCGENGEFHTFVYQAPIFSHSLAISVGEVVEKSGFFFADLLMEEKSPPEA